MAGDVSDEAFARAAQQAGVATFDDLEEARAAQAESARKGVLVALADMLVRQGVITAKTREGIQKRVEAQQAGGLQQLGQYRLLKKLGEGGMGAVYLADDFNVGRKVAVKVLPRKYAENREFLTRFRREAQATGHLNHVNIVSAYTVGEERGYHYYAMEYCEGETLDRVLKQQKLIPWDTAVGIVVQVARGLKHAHEHGIIHRDIKPGNIFICKPLSPAERGAGGEGDLLAEGFVAKILDLGLSKTLGQEQSFYTQTGMALGTPHYISPEQARGEKDIDGRTDIYSLGATFYHLITGETPFQGSSAAIVVMKHLNEQLANPQDLNPDIPGGIVHVVMRMMAKDPADRYRDCRELLDDLELVIDGRDPSSHAIEIHKSSVAVARVPRAASPQVLSRDHKGAVPLAHARASEAPPRGTLQRAPVEQRGSGGAGTAANEPELVPIAPPPHRKPLYIAAAIGALGLLVSIMALSVSAKRDRNEREARAAAGKQKADEAARLAEEKQKADEAARLADEKRKADEAAQLAEEKRQAEETLQKNEAARLQEERRKQAEEQRKREEMAQEFEEEPVQAVVQKPAAPDETIWMEDALPTGASGQGVLTGGSWKWVGQPEPVYSGLLSHTLGLAEGQPKPQGLQRHSFHGPNPPLPVSPPDVLFTYVYLDPKDPPKEIMLEWQFRGSWEHRAYWGDDEIQLGSNLSPSRLQKGLLPKTGEWVRLEVRASEIGVEAEHEAVTGWSFGQFGGTVYWDRAGVVAKPRKPAAVAAPGYEQFVSEGRQALVGKNWNAAKAAFVRALHARPNDRLAQQGLLAAQAGAGDYPAQPAAGTAPDAATAVARANSLVACAREADDPVIAGVFYDRAGSLMDELALEHKGRADKALPGFKAAFENHRKWNEAETSKGKPAPKALRDTLSNAYKAWLAEDTRHVAVKVARIEVFEPTSQGRKAAGEEAISLCEGGADEGALQGQPGVVAWYNYMCGRAWAAIQDQENASHYWKQALDQPVEGMAPEQKKAIAIIRKLIIHDQVKMKMHAKNYDDAANIVLNAMSLAELRSLFDEDAGKELVIDYAKALTLPADAAAWEYEKAVKKLREMIAKEGKGGAVTRWSNEFSRAIAEILQEARIHKPWTPLKLSAAEWYDAAHGFFLMGQDDYLRYEALDRDMPEQAPAQFEKCYAEYQNAVDYYRRTITLARGEKTDLKTRVEVEPKAWFEMELCFLKMKHCHEAIIVNEALRDRYLPETRQRLLKLDELKVTAPREYKAVQETLARLDKPKDGLLACNAALWWVLDDNARQHFDPKDAWYPVLKKALAVLGELPTPAESPAAALGEKDARAMREVGVAATAGGAAPSVFSTNELCGLCVALDWDSGRIAGTGVGGAADLGCFGQRSPAQRRLLANRNGGSRATESSVDLALRWLAYHQEPDGHWDAMKYSSQQKTDTACTGFALLALLGAGHTEKAGAYKGNVQRAVAWLKSKQDAGGLFFDRTDAGAQRGNGYPGAIATLAIVEAAGMANIPDTLAAAQKAVDYCTEKHQCREGSGKGGWRYDPGMPGDLSVSGWFIQALKSAKVGGLHVNPASLDGAIKFLDAVEEKGAGGGAASSYGYQPGSPPPRIVHRLTMIGNLARQLMGRKKEDLQGSVEWAVNTGGTPEWGANGEKVDLYYWYYGTLCVFRQGGEVWRRWNESMKTALVVNQCKQGDQAGSWNPAGDYSAEWGRVGQTALGCLCLEVYYRYLPLTEP